METDPVSGAKFFGREGTLMLLEKRLHAFLHGYRQNVAVLGMRSVGKSSLLAQFRLSMKDLPVIPIYVEVVGEPFEYFLEKWIGAVLDGYFLSAGTGRPASMIAFFRKVRKSIPETFRKIVWIRHLVRKRNWNLAFRELLSLSETVQKETGRRPVLILDNFDSIESYPLSDPFREIGKSIMVQRDAMFVFCGQRFRKSLEIIHHHLSLLFGQFEIVELKPFDFQAALKFMESRLSPVTLSDTLKRFLLSFTDGHPYFLDVLLDSMSKLSRGRDVRSVSENLLIEAMELELFEKGGRLYQYFLMLIRRLEGDKRFSNLVSILNSLSRRPCSLSSRFAFPSQKNGELRAVLQRLMDEELIEKKGSLLRLSLPLFGFWLRHIFSRGAVVPERNAMREHFRRCVKASLGDFEKAETQELPKRVEQLFTRFKNDLVEVDERKFQCPDFCEVVSRPSNGRVFPVLARTQKGRWMCQVAEREVKEDDIRLFLKETEAPKTESQKRILIALAGLETNATLLAKQSKIQIWGLRDLNLLMELYGCPKVIL